MLLLLFVCFGCTIARERYIATFLHESVNCCFISLIGFDENINFVLILKILGAKKEGLEIFVVFALFVLECVLNIQSVYGVNFVFFLLCWECL